MKAKDIMETNVVYVQRQTSVEEIARILSTHKISGVPVLNEEKKVLGIVTEADLLCKDKEPRFPSYIEFLGSIIFIEGVKHYREELKKLIATTAEEIMTKNVHCIGPETSIQEIATIMVEENVNRIPVIDSEERLVGIVSRGDMMKTIVKE